MPTYEYLCSKCGIVEIFHGIKEEDKTVCPECGNTGLEKQISSGGGVIFKYRAANSYNDIKVSKYWRDQNGNRHPVTNADGSLKSAQPTTKKTRNQAQINAIKKRDAEKSKANMKKQSYNDFVKDANKRRK